MPIETPPEDLFGDFEPNLSVDMVQVDADQREVLTQLRDDGNFFLEVFLGEKLESEVPHFHLEMWGQLTREDLDRLLLAVPRGHAKSTLAKLAVVWHFIFTPKRFAAYLSNTNAIALGACVDIIDFIKSPNFEAIFGAPRMITESAGRSLWIFEFMLPNGKYKRCVLRALGANQQVRGLNLGNDRPDLAIADDVEDTDNTANPTLQRALDRWVLGSFVKALSRKPKIIWLGNMITETGLLARFSQNPKWNPVVFGAIIKDSTTGVLRPLWPYLWSVQALIEDYIEYCRLGQRGTWMCEMMNRPGTVTNGFDLSHMTFRPLPSPEDLTATFITIDPAFGLENTHDESAVVVHGVVAGQSPMVLDYYHGRVDETELFKQTLALAVRWNAYVWGIEAVAAQRLLIPLFNLLLAAALMPNVVEMIPLISGAGAPKVARIRGWVSLMADGLYAVPEGDIDITTQVVNYDFDPKSTVLRDLIDSAAFGPLMLQHYRGLIEAHYLTQANELPIAALQLDSEITG